MSSRITLLKNLDYLLSPTDLRYVMSFFLR